MNPYALVRAAQRFTVIAAFTALPWIIVADAMTRGGQ
jgi:hypothetical protein